MPRPSKRTTDHDDNDDDDDNYEYYRGPSLQQHQQQQQYVPPDDAYESDGGWSDDSGHDSDAYVESHRGSQPVAPAGHQDDEVFDATRTSGSRKATSRGTTTAGSKRHRTRLASFFSLSNQPDDTDDHNGDPNDLHDTRTRLQQQPPRNYFANQYYHDAPPASPQQKSRKDDHYNPVMDQAAHAPDVASRAALAAGYAAAEYDNDHSVTHEQLELQQRQQRNLTYPHTSTTIIKPLTLDTAADNKTFRSTALTEDAALAEQRVRYTLACLIIGLVLAVVLVAGLVGGILGSVVFSQANNDSGAAVAAPTEPVTSAPTIATLEPVLTLPPTRAPTPTPLITSQDLYDSIIAALPESQDLIVTDGTPQNLAMLSVQGDDTDLYDTARLLQRYAMRVFFYSTNGPTDWIDTSGWETSDDECSWFTSAAATTPVCDTNDTLITLELSANGVTGTLPDELSLLTGLVRLYIKGVAGSPGLTGPIPESLSLLTNMEVVLLNDHLFASPLPDTLLSAWNKLTVINIIGSGLTGTVPSTVGSLLLCSNFLLDSNELSGALPPAIGSMTSLVAFGASGNQLTGTLPALSIASMKMFNVSSNLLTGAVPSFAGMPLLVKLSLEGNAFSGSLDMCGSTLTVVDCAVTCSCGCTCV